MPIGGRKAPGWGAYGRYWACLFACCAPEDYVWGPGSQILDHQDFIGPHHAKGDSIRYWVQWLATTRNRVLELPEVYLDSRVVKSLTSWSVNRRESEIDDHGETYPTTWQGPDINVALHIPKGEYNLSLYDFNKDGHHGANRSRDYLISAEALPPETSVRKITGQVGAAGVYSRPARVAGRVVNFCGGVWNRYLVRGPMVLLIRVGRNCSFNTILCGAALDSLNEHPAPYYYGMKAWRVRLKQLSKAREALRQHWLGINGTLPKTRETVSSNYFAKRLLRDEEFILHENPKAWAESDQLVYTSLFRRLVARDGRRFTRAKRGQLAMAARVAYRLSLFSLWEGIEQRLDITTSRQIEKGLRWDQWRDSYRGLEFRTIRKYLRGLKTRQPKAATN